MQETAETQDANLVCAEQLAGIWKADYTVSGDGGETVLSGEHYVQAFVGHDEVLGSEILVKSIPELTSAHLVANFLVDGDTAAGTWRDTNLEKGTTLPGSATLAISADRAVMRGKWIAFGDDLAVLTGLWVFTHLGRDMSRIVKEVSGFQI